MGDMMVPRSDSDNTTRSNNNKQDAYLLNFWNNLVKRALGRPKTGRLSGVGRAVIHRGTEQKVKTARMRKPGFPRQRRSLE